MWVLVAPIFYRKDRFSVEKSGNFWLAEDINAIGKKGWDAACERVATWAILKDKNTGKKFFFLNTHLDHMGKVARHEGASLVLEQAKKLSENLPIIVTGDFIPARSQGLLTARNGHSMILERSLTTSVNGLIISS